MSLLKEMLTQADLSGRFAGYQPHFRLDEFQPGTWWILDGEIKVGLLARFCDFAELTNYDPFNPRTDLEFPRYYHAPTMPGDRITYAKWIDAQSTTSDENTLEFTVEEQQITALFREQWDNGRTATTRMTWKVDADFGYVLACESTMRSPEAESHEYCNFLPRGTTDDRPENARYPYVLWQHPSGKIIRWNQNNIGARALGALDIHERRRIKNGGFVGFFGEQDRASVVEILDSSPESAAGTCPNMLDEHILWVPKDVAQYEQDADGNSLCHASYRLVSVPASIGEALNAQAEMLDMVLDRRDPELEALHTWCADEYPQSAGAPKSLRFPPFSQGKVTDFETKLDPASSFRGTVFQALDAVDAPEAPIVIADDCAHSGTHSLRFRPDGETLQALAYGVSLHVTEGQRYRLSAWIKTDLLDGEATLTASEFLFSPATTTAVHRAIPVQGDTDWQQVAVEFVPGEKAHVVQVIIDVTGHGTVWVDDVLLEKVE